MTIFEGDIYMKLEDAKILIGDDSILARKQLKDVLTTFGGKHFSKLQMGRKQLKNLKLKNRISYS